MPDGGGDRRAQGLEPRLEVGQPALVVLAERLDLAPQRVDVVAGRGHVLRRSRGGRRAEWSKEQPKAGTPVSKSGASTMNLRERMRTAAAARAAAGGSGGRGATDALLGRAPARAEDDGPRIRRGRGRRGAVCSSEKPALETGDAPGPWVQAPQWAGSLEVALEVVVQQRA